MTITVEIPDDVLRGPEGMRQALEAFVIEGYRSEALSHFQASEMLGLTSDEFEGFLKRRGVFDHAYDVEDLERDIRTLRQMQAEGLMRS
jgi:predicted HTH domain antitoxin